MDEYCQSGAKPHDIPANPYLVYAQRGWAGWGDWLGTGNISWGLWLYRSFERARAFVRSLGLRSSDEWYEYCSSGKKPTDIPVNPRSAYRTKGWLSMGDWLGTEAVATYLREYRGFSEARAFVRRLGLKSKDEWATYRKSGKKPADIPSNPQKVYGRAGWAGWGDWFGTGTVAPHLREYRAFDKARAFVRHLGLRSFTEWRSYCKSGKKPADVPSDPRHVYGADWAGWGDWLGTGTVAPGLREYRAFDKARAFVRRLGLKSRTEWRAYRSSGKKPVDIPSNPQRVYAEVGWVGMGDWLGTGTVAPRFREYQPFEKGRAFVRSLGLRSSDEWYDYCRSGKKPTDIPATPYQTYADAGWAGMGDWLGTGRRRGTGWRPFSKARAFVRGLGLKSQTEWSAYCRSGRKPNDIPACPSRTYADAGWAGMGDWLGTGRLAASRWRESEGAYRVGRAGANVPM
jgi:hypothetical protein